MCGYINMGKFVINLGCLVSYSLSKREGDGIKGVEWRGIIISLASCVYYFTRVHKYLVQHPSNSIYRFLKY